MIRRIEIPKERRIPNGSRGRNRSFSLARVTVWDPGTGVHTVGDNEPEVVIFGNSARSGKHAPVVLTLKVQDAEEVGVELLKIALTHADTFHRLEAIRALRAILAKLEGEGEGDETRPLVRDREDPAVHQTTGLDR